MTGEFLDSSVLVYAFTSDPRAETSQRLLARGCTISVQGLNEFANVAKRKLGMPWSELKEALSLISTVCSAILPVEIQVHVEALRIAERYGYTIFDSLMIAAALQAKSDTLWSEDMQHDMIIDDQLRIINPFKG
jgi:predicted nucleic acid-binding protein